MIILIILDEHHQRTYRVRTDRTSAAVDADLDMTFPASEPIAIYSPEEAGEERQESARRD
jgi:hypothetical protein